MRESGGKEVLGGGRANRSPVLAFGLLLAFAWSMAVGSAHAAGWLPDEPQDGEWDWLQLDTQEWVKGELLVVQDDEVEFHSENFDQLTVDLGDVVQLRPSKPRVFRRVGKRTYPGVGRIEGGRVYVVTPEGPVDFPVRELVSVVYTNEEEIRNWIFRAGTSIDARSGNTEQQDFSANALVRRDGPFLRWQSRYLGVITRVDDEKTAENHRVSTELDFLLTQHFFIRAPGFEYYQDAFQNIDHRFTPGVSIGFEPIDTNKTELIFTVGGAAQYTQYENEDRDEWNGAAIVSSELSLDLPKGVDLDMFYRLQLVPADFGQTSHQTRAVLSYELYDPLELDLGFYWDRIESPEPGNDGETPKRDDFRFTVGFSLDL